MGTMKNMSQQIKSILFSLFTTCALAVVVWQSNWSGESLLWMLFFENIIIIATHVILFRLVNKEKDLPSSLSFSIPFFGIFYFVYSIFLIIYTATSDASVAWIAVLIGVSIFLIRYAVEEYMLLQENTERSDNAYILVPMLRSLPLHLTLILYLFLTDIAFGVIIFFLILKFVTDIAADIITYRQKKSI